MTQSTTDDQFSFVRTFKYSRKDNQNPFYIKYYSGGGTFIPQRIQSKHEKPIIIKEKDQDRLAEQNIPKVYKEKNQKYGETQNKQLAELKQFAKIDLKKLKKQKRKQAYQAQKWNEKEQTKQYKKEQQKVQKPKKEQRYRDKKDNKQSGLFNLTKNRSRSIDYIQAKDFKKPNKEVYQKKSYNNTNRGKTLYDEYLDIEVIEQSRRKNEKKYFKGVVQFSERIKIFAKIKTTQADGNFVAQGKHRNRCIHEDQVYFQIIQETPLKTFCKIVYIIEPEHKRQIVGRIDFLESKRLYYITPNNQRFIAMNVRMNEIQKQWLKQINDQYFLVEFHSWERQSEYPQCRVIQKYGKFGDIDIESNALLRTHNVYEKQYSESEIQTGLHKFLSQVDLNGQYLISKEQIAKRVDLRQEMIFTIDPLRARDFDDALSIKKLTVQDLQRLNIKTSGVEQNQVYQIGVHIADASFFVEEGSIIDEQAKKRTTSVYLVHKVLPMLPRVLCQTMCSLNPGLQRLTLSVWFYIDLQGNVLPGQRYERTLIKSKARFTYEQAQQIIDGKIKSQKDIDKGFGCIEQKDEAQIFHAIKVMNTIAMKLRKNRIQGGSLILETPKKGFTLNEQHFPIAYQIKGRIESNFLVEEYMLLANRKVGQILVNHMRSQALLRRHKFPGEKKISTFEAFMKKIGCPLKIDQTTRVQQQINKILTNPALKSTVRQIIKHQMIYLLQMAEYFIVGQTAQRQWLHYALNMPVYTHFTSPIRRYPDIMVHRLLIQVIQARNESRAINLKNQQSLRQLVQRCNKNKVSAKKVSTGCQKIFLCLYLKQKPVITQAILVAVEEWGFKISIPRYDCRVSLKANDIKNLKVLKLQKTQQDKKYMQAQVRQGDIAMKLVFKQLQQVQVQLGSTDTFPLDYMVRFVFPHPKIPNQKIVIK